MGWYEITVNTAEMSIDAVSNMFYDLGANGVQIINPDDPDLQGNASGLWDFFDPQNITLDVDGVTVTGYLDLDVNAVENVVQTIHHRLKDMQSFGLDIGNASVTYKAIDSQSWESEWKKYFKPFRLGTNMVVKPTWESFDAKDTDVIIEIDPGNAFGSGTHETTYLCIEMLEKYIQKDQTVVDVGCGSGILSIAAGLLGAKNVIGIDIDHVAVKTAKENVSQNALDDRIEILHGDLLNLVDATADIVVANIIAEVISVLLKDIGRVLKTDGIFIASGIINLRLEWLLEQYLPEAFYDVQVVQKGEWAAIVARKK